jgi:hypothetical protein
MLTGLEGPFQARQSKTGSRFSSSLKRIVLKIDHEMKSKLVNCQELT